MKIVFITTIEILGPQNRGDVQCATRNISLLKRAFGDENVHICAITGEQENLAKSSENTAVFYDSRSKMSVLKHALTCRRRFGIGTENRVLEHVLQLECDVVFFDISYIGFLPKRLPKEIKQVLFMHNVERNIISRRLYLHPYNLPLVLVTAANESLAVKHADVVISLNERDAVITKKYYKRKPDLILPITFDDTFSKPGEAINHNLSHTLQLLFVGTLFASNEVGVTWFVNEVMPCVNAEFTVVGKGFEKIANKLNRANVKVIGTVDDISEYYYSASAVVSPILFGDGMKVKTAEALMYGKPMFATDEALEGYDVEGIKNVHRCNTAQEFIKTINAHADNPPFLSFDENIRKLFLEKYHTPIHVSAIRALLTER